VDAPDVGLFLQFELLPEALFEKLRAIVLEVHGFRLAEEVSLIHPAKRLALAHLVERFVNFGRPREIEGRLAVAFREGARHVAEADGEARTKWNAVLQDEKQRIDEERRHLFTRDIDKQDRFAEIFLVVVGKL